MSVLIKVNKTILRKLLAHIEFITSVLTYSDYSDIPHSKARDAAIEVEKILRKLLEIGTYREDEVATRTKDNGSNSCSLHGCISSTDPNCPTHGT